MAFSKELEEVIEAALADGVITEKERAVIHKKALVEGIDPDEIDVVMDGRLAKMRKNQEDWNLPVNPVHIEKEKHGNIVKCPNCGEPVPGGAAVCPACGHEFRNIEANRTAKAFAEGLKKLKKEQYAGRDLRKQAADMEKEDSFVENFPIPNTSEDLFEIIKLIKPKAKKDNEAYWNLFTRCIDSVNTNFPNDKRFLPFVKY